MFICLALSVTIHGSGIHNNKITPPSMPASIYPNNLFAIQYQPDAEAFPCCCDFVEKREVLSFLSQIRDLGTWMSPKGTLRHGWRISADPYTEQNFSTERLELPAFRNRNISRKRAAFSGVRESTLPSSTNPPFPQRPGVHPSHT